MLAVRRFTRFALVAVLAALVGQYLWCAYGPGEQPKYLISTDGPALAGTDAAAKHLYLRRTLHLPVRPRHGWIEVLSRDAMTLYVNGQMVATRAADGYTQIIVADIAPYLREGENLIALSVQQFLGDQPPRVAIRGEYEIAGAMHKISPDDQWRSNRKFSRDGHWWFTDDFDDRNWDVAKIAKAKYLGETLEPPRSITEPSHGKWITPVGKSEAGVATLRRTFEVDDVPREAWLRVSSTSAYRLAVNGDVIDVQEGRLGIPEPATLTLRRYDLSGLMRRGTNTISLWLTSLTEVPHVLVDGEVIGGAGKHARIASDDEWLSASGLPNNWLADSIDDAANPWKPCIVETGDLTIQPWSLTRELVAFTPPAVLTFRQAAGRLFLTSAIAVLVGLACAIGSRWLHGRQLMSDEFRGDAAYAALALPIIALAAGWFATFDPRVAPDLIYRSVLLPASLAMIPLQWLLLGFWRGSTAAVRQQRQVREMLVRHGASLAAIGIIVLGCMLRLDGYKARELGADEVHMYRCTMGAFKYGFPGYIVSDDLPVQYVATSTLVYLGPILVALFSDDALEIIRLPSVIWGTLTIGLLYLTGRRMFGPVVGLVAATIYAISPVAISMANFGRYPSQLQFTSLLAVYWFWRAIENHETFSRKYLWLTTAAFIAVFMSWQAAVFLGVGMAISTLLDRRGNLRSVVVCDTIWKAAIVVVLVVLAQSAYRGMFQSGRLDYGMGASEVSLTAMWRHAHFELWRFVRQSAWTELDLLPIFAVALASLLTLRHAWRRATQTLATILLTTAGLMALTLPVTAGRYAYFLAPISILLAAVTFVAIARMVQNLVRHTSAPRAWLTYGSAVATIIVVAGMAFASELTTQLSKLRTLAREGDRPGLLSSRSLAGPSHYLADHIQPGDIVLSTQPYLVDHHVARSNGGEHLDAADSQWLQTRLHLQAVLDDARSEPLNRRDGTPVVATPQALDELFARHKRIWYVAALGHHNRLNTDPISALLRQQMEVAYEDVESLVLLHDDMQHRPAKMRVKDEQALTDAEANFLP